jgi:ferredoxin
MMARLRVNGIEVEVDNGATVLDAAARAGAEVPTLCYLREIGAITSCMVCVVKDRAGGQMLPACSAEAVDGMVIDTDGEEVRAARREVLKMLLSEHVGDCEGPCSRICPAGLDVPRMLRYIAAGHWDAAARIAKRELIFPATLGRLCTAPCEKGCRRAEYDAPVAIRRLHGEAGERAIREGPVLNECAPGTGKTVAVVGAGIAGLCAAWVCLLKGHACRVYERQALPCASLRSAAGRQEAASASLPQERLPPEVLDAEIDSIRDLGAEFILGCQVGGWTAGSRLRVGRDISLDSLRAEFDAVVVACDHVSSRVGGWTIGSHLSDSGVFTAQEDAMPVRAVAQGKAAAQRADAFLGRWLDGRKPPPCGLPGDGIPRGFNSRIGRLRPEDMAAYAVERLDRTERAPAATNGSGAEASRCLHCDCLKPASCKLRQYAEEYGVSSRVERHMKRPSLEPIQRCEDVLFEPGKCIKCGICVEITQAASEDLGLTFVGRGLTGGVRAPFGEPLARGLGKAAAQCVRACPTGALAFLSKEETE